jgi:hypothetical protein
MKNVLIILALLSLTFLFWLSPVKPNREKYSCPTIIHVTGSLNFTIDCDTTQFLKSAANPGELLGVSAYQSRPLFLLSGTLLGKFSKKLYGYGLVNHLVDKEKLQNLIILHPRINSNPEIFLYYPGYIIINFVILGLALYLFNSLLSEDNNWSSTILLASVLLVFNSVTKTYVWSAHTQLFNILLPLTLFYVSKQFIEKAPDKRKSIYSYAFSFGLLPLFYGSFVLIPFVAITAIIIREKLNQVKLLTLATTVRTLSAGLLFLMPTIIWVYFSFYVARGLYFGEIIDFRQFIWMYDSFSAGAKQFLLDASNNLSTFLIISFKTLWSYLLLLAAALLIFKYLAKERREIWNQRKLFLINFANVLIWLLLFFGLMGYYRTSLAFNLVPPFLLAIAMIFEMTINKARNNIRPKVIGGLLLLIIFWSISVIFL